MSLTWEELSSLHSKIKGKEMITFLRNLCIEIGLQRSTSMAMKNAMLNIGENHLIRNLDSREQHKKYQDTSFKAE